MTPQHVCSVFKVITLFLVCLPAVAQAAEASGTIPPGVADSVGNYTWPGSLVAVAVAMSRWTPPELKFHVVVEQAKK